MKITKEELANIIKEEVEKVIGEDELERFAHRPNPDGDKFKDLFQQNLRGKRDHSRRWYRYLQDLIEIAGRQYPEQIYGGAQFGTSIVGLVDKIKDHLSKVEAKHGKDSPEYEKALEKTQKTRDAYEDEWHRYMSKILPADPLNYGTQKSKKQLATEFDQLDRQARNMIIYYMSGKGRKTTKSPYRDGR